MSLQTSYRLAQRLLAWTVDEFEVSLGLPPFSVYPELRNVTSPADQGFFIYRHATSEERLTLTE